MSMLVVVGCFDVVAVPRVAVDAGACCGARGPHQGRVGVVPGPDWEAHARSRKGLGGGRCLETPSGKKYS